MNKLIPILFLIPVLFLAIWVNVLKIRQENGQPVTVRIMGYDPRDLLSGHYIQYQIDWNKTDCTQFEKGICPQKEFYTTKRRGRPITNLRFYIPEENATQLDRLFRIRSDQLTFEVVYAYRKGVQPLAKQLLINGMDWREYIKTNGN